MFEYYLEVGGGLNILIVHPRPIFAEERTRLMAGAYLPGLKFLKSPTSEPDIVIEVQPFTVRPLFRFGNRVIVQDGGDGDGSLLDLLNLTYGLARQWWIKRGFYPVHSACVGKYSYVLLVGSTGAGKTSVSLNMARTFGQKIFSGNKTLIAIDDVGKVKAVAGTRTVTARARDAGRHYSGKVGNVDYPGRKAFAVSGSMAPRADEVRIKSIVTPILNDGAENFARLDPASALHRLYSFFLDADRAATICCGGNAVMFGDLPQIAYDRLLASLSLATAKIPVYSVTGSMDFVTGKLADI